MHSKISVRAAIALGVLIAAPAGVQAQTDAQICMAWAARLYCAAAAGASSLARGLSSMSSELRSSRSSPLSGE